VDGVGMICECCLDEEVDVKVWIAMRAIDWA
jgi:hypothetical protein